MPISSFARLGASALTLAFGLLLPGESPALAGPKPALSTAAPRAVDASRAGSTRTKAAKRSRTVKATTVKTTTTKGKPAPTAGSVAKAASPEAMSTEAMSTEAPAVTWTSAEPDELRCGRSRRKLWQAGEGWMVKTVTVCR